jgi:3-hydroxyisobutyrate dehydrogenase-like beta-hydroxyacid dehydrogenase
VGLPEGRHRANVAPVAGEALLARAAGVDEGRLVDALGEGSARAWAVENWRFLSREWIDSQPGGAGAVFEIVDKDLTLAKRTAEELGVEAPFASVAASTLPAVLGSRR